MIGRRARHRSACAKSGHPVRSAGSRALAMDDQAMHAALWTGHGELGSRVSDRVDGAEMRAGDPGYLADGGVAVGLLPEEVGVDEADAEVAWLVREAESSRVKRVFSENGSAS